MAELGLAAAVAELRPGRQREDAGRRVAGGHGGRRREHAVDSGCRLGDLARAPVATGRRLTAVSRPATWWRSPPACSPVATSVRSAAPGRSATSTAFRRSLSTLGCPVGQAVCRMPARRRRRSICSPPTRLPASRCRRCRSRGVWAWALTRRSSPAPAGDRGRGATGAGHGAGGHGLCLGTGSRRGVRA